jgi:hypothetical protein
MSLRLRSMARRLVAIAARVWSMASRASASCLKLLRTISLSSTGAIPQVYSGGRKKQTSQPRPAGQRRSDDKETVRLNVELAYGTFVRVPCDADVGLES